jgi:hypothetical protein
MASTRIHMHGPLDWESWSPIQLGLAARPGRKSDIGIIALVNKSRRPVTLTRVVVAPQPGVAPIGYHGVYIVGPRRSVGEGVDQQWGVPRRPVNGYKVSPTPTHAEAPLLVLEIGPGVAPRTYNNDVQVSYHDADGNRYVAPYPLRFVVCNTARARPRCAKRLPPG